MTRLLLLRVKSSLARNGVREKSMASWEYCVDLVRRGDFENYLCSLLLPSEGRAAAFAVRAFNIEVARVADQTKDAQRGAMRMQFWRDVLDGVYAADAAAIPATPVATELRKALLAEDRKLNKRWFSRLIQARLDRLPASKPFRGLAEVEEYGEQVASSVNYLILEALGQPPSVKADHAASHLGKAQFFASLVRGIGPMASQGIVLLPMELMAQHGLSQEEVVRVARGKRQDEVAAKKLSEVTFEVGSAAHQHLQKARHLTVEADLSSKSLLAFLPGLCVADYLKRLRNVDFNPLDKSLTVRPPLLPLKLAWRKIRGGVPVPNTLAPPEVRQACSRKAPRAVKKEPEGRDETGEDVGGKEAHDGKDVFEMPEWRDHPGGSKFEYRPKFNTGPSTFVPIMVSGIHFGLDPGTRVIQPMHWGLVPPWHKNENFRSHGLTTINCRHETLLQKQLFSKPLKQNKRGVLICDGFYEWRRKDGSKQPYYFFFHQPDKEILPGDPAWRKHVEKIWDPQTGWHGPRPLTVAVVFDLWHPPKEDADHPEIRSFSVITVPASKTVEFVHDRMPAILDGDEAIDKWLDPNVKVEDALKSLRGHSGLAFHKVSTHCNNVHNDSVVCVRPLTDSTMKIGNQATIMNFFKKRTTTETESGSVKRSMEEEGTVKEETSSGKKAKTE